MYRLGQRKEQKRKRKTRWFVVTLIVIAVIIVLIIYLLSLLKPNTTIQQSAPTVKKVSYDEKQTTKKYDQPDFTITLPISWQAQPRPAGQYQSYVWTNINKNKNGENLTIYQDTIPLKFAVNRVIILEPGIDKMSIKGDLSDNCVMYTKSQAYTSSSVGVPARWQGVDFICDQGNYQRDVIGTSSVQGINTVILKSPSTGKEHKFFFTYTNNSINGDYTVFKDALNSFVMK